jgi:hypothetical protein
MADRQLRSARNLEANAPEDVIQVNWAFPQGGNEVESVEMLRSQFTTPVSKLRKLFAQELLEKFRFKAVVSVKMKFFRVIFLSLASFSSH